jgi:SH3-like domain-containing protein
VGYLNRIYVAIPINGETYVAQGGVLSYYEFIQPREERLTDEAWREILLQDPPFPPAWTVNFMVPGGRVVDVLAFRIGDVYVVTEEGGDPPLNLRAEPSRTAKVITTLETDTYFEIIEGPELIGKETWWKVRIFNEDTEGWLLENQTWYRRSY